MMSRKIKFSCEVIINSVPSEIFPLLCPKREYEWIEHWSCEILHSESGYAEVNCVFKTSFPDDGPDDIWIVNRYEPNKLIEFIRNNNWRVIHYTIKLEDLQNGTTKTTWEQTLISLTDEGTKLKSNLTEATFCSDKKLLGHMLNHYLETGEMLKVNI